MMHPDELVAQVITLSHRNDRQAQFTAHALNRGVRFNFVHGVTGGMPHKNISAAHKACVRRAKEAGLEMALIMEDDCWFPAQMGFHWFLQNIPRDYFDVYLGGVYSEYVNPDGTLDFFCGLHCYIVHSRFYDRFLNAIETEHIDYALKGTGTFRVVRPFAALQRDGHSDNSGKVLDLTTNMTGSYLTDETYATLNPSNQNGE